jgi:hypothetical protein
VRSILVAADRYSTERLFRNDVIDLPCDDNELQPGDHVALIACLEPPVVFALATVEKVVPSDDMLTLAYTHRFFDDPQPAAALDRDSLVALAGRSEAPKRSWLVSIDLPIEAASAADAVRQFWTYVRELGPAELPVFVSPTDDELAMQTFVLGAEANQDPEDD